MKSNNIIINNNDFHNNESPQPYMFLGEYSQQC